MISLIDALAFPWRVIQKLFALSFWRLTGRNEEVPVNESHPANLEVLRYLKTNAEEQSKWALTYFLKPHHTVVHQDLGERLEELERNLPQRCHSWCYGCPVLVHPRGGVIFAVATNWNSLALRLPERDRTHALASGAFQEIHSPGGFGFPSSTLHIKEVGNDWVFVPPWASDDHLGPWFRAAYDYAKELGHSV